MALDSFGYQLASSPPPPSTPDIEVTPTRVDFGSVPLGQSIERSVNVRNTGAAPLTVNSIISTAPAFQVVSPTGSFTVVAGSQQTVSVRLTPSAAGLQIGMLNISSNDPDEATVIVQLSGSGQAAGAPEIEIMPASLNFGTVVTGSTVDLQVSVMNTGSAPLNVSPAVGSNVITPIPPFSLVSPLSPFTVPAGGLQIITVRFTPTIEGVLTGSLNLLTNDPDEIIVIVPLSGIGTTPSAPDIDVTPTSLDFGAVAIGQSTERMLTVRNTGNASLIVTGLTLNQPDFSLSAPAVPFTVSAGSEQSITVRFQPMASGLQTGMLSMTSNDPDESTVNVNLIGNAAIIGFAEQEPNDSTATANQIQPNVNVLGAIGQGGDTDVFSVNIEAGQRLRIEIRARRLNSPSPLDTMLILMNNRGTQLNQNDNIDDTLNDSRLDVRLLAAGQYFFQVKSADPDAGGAAFRYEAIVIVTDSTFQEREANNDLDQANRITPDVLVAGAIDAPGDADFFSVSASGNQTLTIMIQARSLAPSLPTAAVLTIFDANGQERARAQATSLSADAALQFTIPANGRYYIRVEQSGGAAGGSNYLYFMRVALTSNGVGMPGSPRGQ
jgi:hypothetical protein